MISQTENLIWTFLLAAYIFYVKNSIKKYNYEYFVVK